MITRLIFLFLWAVLSVLFGYGRVSAQTSLYWDTNGAAVYSGNAGGTWGTDNFWTSDANGLSATGAYVSGRTVVFAAGTDGTGSYTVTLSSNQSAAGLNFQEGHVTLAPANAPTSTDSSLVQVLALTGTAPTVNVQNMDAIVTTKVTGSGLTKTGVGKLTLNYGVSGSSSYFNLAGAPITINGGTLELAGTGGSANQLNTSGITINSGGTFLWTSGVNNISDSTLFTVNTGGILIGKVNDQIGSLAGSGLISVQGGSINMALGNTANMFSGLIAGSGTLQANSGNGTLTLTNINTFSGIITAATTNTNTGGIRLGNARAAQNASIRLQNTTVTASNISFSSGIGTFIVGSIDGTSNLTLQDVSGAAIILQAGNNDTSTVYKGILSGSGSLTKIGTGTLTLTGETSGANTYTGDTVINGGAHNATNSSVTSTTAGTLKLDFSPTTANAPAADIINSASRLVLGGGRLLVSGKNTATAASQTFSSTRLSMGRSYVTVTQGTASTDTVVNLGAISRTAGTILEFTLPAGTQSLTNGITTTTANDASGILGGWAITGTDWAMKSTAGTTIGNVTAAGSGVYTTYGTGDIVSSAASNLLVNNTSTTITTASGTTDLNTIMVRNNTDNSTVVRTFDIAAGETLRLGVTGSIWSQGAGAVTFGTAANVGTLTAGGAPDTAGEIILDVSGNGALTINSSIKDNGAGAVTLVRTGSGGGQVTLSGTNTFSGGSFFTQGRTIVGNAGALGTGAVTVTAGGQLWINAGGTYAQVFNLAGSGYGEANVGGALRLSGGQTFSNTVNLTGDARIGAVNSGSISTFAGKITGDYALDLAGYSGGTNVIVLSNTANDFTGNFSIDTNLNGATAFNAGIVTVRLGASEVLPNGLGKGNVILSASTTGSSTLDLNGFSETINGLTSYGTGTNIFITNSKAGTTSTLTIGDNKASTLAAANATYTTAFAGIIQDTGTGLMAVTKIGDGTMTFAGANTYSGDTTISKGILQAGAVNALSANSNVVIASDATAMLALTNGIADFSQTIAALSGGGTVNLGTIAAADTLAAPGTRLTTGGSADTTYAGVIVGGGGLVKQGFGVFALSGTNTYLGTTTVSAGNLQVGVSGSGQSGSGATTVAANAVLSGTGTVQGATTVNGTIRPGDTAGSGIGRLTFSDLTTSSLTLAGGGSSASPRAEFTLAGATGHEANPMDGIQTAAFLTGAPAAGTHDSINVLGTLNLDAGSTISVTFATGFSPTFGDVFNLLDWASLSPGAFNAAATGGDLVLEISPTMTANGWFWDTDQFLSDGIIYVVPEPGRLGLLAVGLALLASRRRRTGC